MQPGGEHRGTALIQTVVEQPAGRVEADTQKRKPVRGSRESTSDMGCRAAKHTSMARISLGVSLAWIRAAEGGSRRISMRCSHVLPSLLRDLAQPFAQRLVAFGACEQALGQSPEIQAGSPGHNGKTAAGGDFVAGWRGRRGCSRPR